jgi:hypothetical protein
MDNPLVTVRKLIPIEVLQLWYIARTAAVNGALDHKEHVVLWILWGVFLLLAFLWKAVVVHMSDDARVRLQVVPEATLACAAFGLITFSEGDPFGFIGQKVRVPFTIAAVGFVGLLCMSLGVTMGTGAAAAGTSTQQQEETKRPQLDDTGGAGIGLWTTV